MFIRVKGLRITPLRETYSFYHPNDIDPDSAWASFSTVPKGLVPLDQSDWPDDVQASIVESFKAIGVPNPLKQKLVEPYVIAFGGDIVAGVAVWKDVDWQKVKDYFVWEAATLNQDDELSLKLQKKAEKKYGHRFNHKAPYGD